MSDCYGQLHDYFSQKGYGENEIPKLVRDTAFALDVVLAKAKEEATNGEEKP